MTNKELTKRIKRLERVVLKASVSFAPDQPGLWKLLNEIEDEHCLKEPTHDK